MTGISTNNNRTTYRTVIMDGTSVDIVVTIVRIIDLLSKNDSTFAYELDMDHPSMIVLETNTDDSSYNSIKEVIDIEYPGLCVFNPPM